MRCKVEARADLPAPRYRIAEDRILDAACAVFAAEGFDRARMEAIAARAGTTKPTLYARFGTKEGLFAAAVRREYELLMTRLFAAYDGRNDEPFRARLHRWTAAYFDFVRERPDGFRLSSEGERYHVAAAIIDRANDRIIARIAELVARPSAAGADDRARVVAAMIAGMLTWAAREAVSRGHADLDVACILCESFLHAGLRDLDLDVDRP